MRQLPKKYRILKAVVCGLCLVLSSCGTARRSEPIMGPLTVQTQQLENGRVVFMQNCHRCHPLGEAGLGPSINNIPLPGVALRFRVRSKAFFLGIGRMPSFKKHEISREQMDELVVYLKALRRHKGNEAVAATK
ncbi:c-type cytochrome [Rufibacter latericius]|uniref:Cytochrome c n=1 Tax=Rufibacter latericius TaxID=2487040 RepID=A0A3M9MKE7_9BACT|nr:cytochrome c [Rufibacter latericius]RNI25677.1 cytochrome c [Rufibacter latericius]